MVGAVTFFAAVCHACGPADGGKFMVWQVKMFAGDVEGVKVWVTSEFEAGNFVVKPVTFEVRVLGEECFAVEVMLDGGGDFLPGGGCGNIVGADVVDGFGAGAMLIKEGLLGF